MNNANLIWILINALNAILIIIELNILKEIIMDNAYARMDIMMIIKIVYVNNVLLFGIYTIFKLNNLYLSTLCSYTFNNSIIFILKYLIFFNNKFENILF